MIYVLSVMINQLKKNKLFNLVVIIVFIFNVPNNGIVKNKIVLSVENKLNSKNEKIL